MFLAKPNALVVPSYSAPIGIGLEACNSGNSCDNQSCDVNGGGSQRDALDYIQTAAAIVVAAATAAG